MRLFRSLFSRLADFRSRRWFSKEPRSAGPEVQARIVEALSTYLGHARVRDTYWYLSAFPGLMQEAARRLDRRWEARS